jgi:hypothetical protein
MGNELVLLAGAVAVWSTLLVLLLREVPRTAWRVVFAGAAAPLLVGLIAAGLKYPSWEAVLLLLGAPALAITVTSGRPVRLLDPKWTMAEEDITAEAEEAADRYAWRLVVVLIVAVVLLMITFGW